MKTEMKNLWTKSFRDTPCETFFSVCCFPFEKPKKYHKLVFEYKKREKEFNVMFIFRRFHDKYQFIFNMYELIIQHFIIKQASRHLVIRNALFPMHTN